MLVFLKEIPISQKVMVLIKTYSHPLLSCPVKTVLYVISYEPYSLKQLAEFYWKLYKHDEFDWFKKALHFQGCHRW